VERLAKNMGFSPTSELKLFPFLKCHFLFGRPKWVGLCHNYIEVILFFFFFLWIEGGGGGGGGWRTGKAGM
jgi:hypothetical protein